MPRPKRSLEESTAALEVGRRLSQIREDRRLSQDEFVSKLGRGTRRAMGDYESGKVMVPTDLARRVCQEFDISFDWLMTGRGPHRGTEVIREAESRRAEEEAYQTLKAVQDVVQRKGYPADSDVFQTDETSLDALFRRALRLSLSRLERQFNPKKGSKQFAEFLEDLIVTTMDVWGDARGIAKGILVAQSARFREAEEDRRRQSLERTFRPPSQPSGKVKKGTGVRHRRGPKNAET